jgi:putative CocE/NonD family hydrolase
LGVLHDPLRSVWRKLPVLADADALAAGQRVSFFQDWLEHASPEAPWWQPLDFQRTLNEVTKPVCMIAGWDDIFTPWQLQDFTLLQRAGRDVQLVVGPWKHLDLPVNAYGIREAITFFQAQLSGDRSQLRKQPVRVYVRGAKVWRDFDAWPPREAQPVRYHLQPKAALARELPEVSARDAYTYDPEDPTPSIGGPTLTFAPARVDNRELEARSDVLTYTSAPLDRALDVIGPVTAELWVSSDRETCDFFVRLCEVDARGRSHNVCDGLARVRFAEIGAPVAGAHRVQVALWPTAQRFRAGRRIRVQVSSGAYPRWAINPGTLDKLGAASARVRQRQQLFHGLQHPSAIVLSVVPSA